MPLETLEVMEVMEAVTVAAIVAAVEVVVYMRGIIMGAESLESLVDITAAAESLAETAAEGGVGVGTAAAAEEEALMAEAEEGEGAEMAAAAAVVVMEAAAVVRAESLQTYILLESTLCVKGSAIESVSLTYRGIATANLRKVVLLLQPSHSRLRSTPAMSGGS